MVADCACDFCISPRSALIRTPKATDAITIAIVDRMRFIDEFMVIGFPPRASRNDDCAFVLGNQRACIAGAIGPTAQTPSHDMTNIRSGSSASRTVYAGRHIFVEDAKSPAESGAGGNREIVSGGAVRPRGAGRRSGDR